MGLEDNYAYQISEENVTNLESVIDEYLAKTPDIKAFINDIEASAKTRDGGADGTAAPETGAMATVVALWIATSNARLVSPK